MGKEYLKNTGLSFVYGPEDPSRLINDINTADFKGLELPGSFLEKDDILSDIRDCELEIYNITDLFPISLSGSIADQSSNIIEDFKERFIEILERMFSAGLRRVTVDLALDSVVDDSERRLSRVELLKSFIPHLYKRSIDICLPVRIPSHAGHSSDYYVSFLKDLMYSGINLSINIYPHELGNDFSAEKLLSRYRFDMGIARFIYEPETGNYLVEKNLNPWFETFEKFSFKGPLVFCPKISDAESYITEMTKISGLRN